MPTTLTAGDRAPDFDLETDSGGRVSLGDLAGRWAVLYWYPKDDTPGCTTEACDIRDNFAMLSGEAEVYGISPDSVKSHGKFRTKYELPFGLLADADHAVSERYGVWGPKKFMGREYMGVDRTTFIIAPDGKIARVFEILEALQELKK